MLPRALPLLLLGGLAWGGDHPLSKDRTGVAWVLPFRAARDKAKASHRLLLIKPVAFGTTPDGGW